MPQPDLHAPLPRRPEPGPELLEAVSRRESQRCLRLSEQWVHRRGITDLLRFCREELSAHEGAAAAAWLQELLSQDTAVAPAGSTPELAAPMPEGLLPGSGPALATAAAPAPAAAETTVSAPVEPEAPETLAISEGLSTDVVVTMAPPMASPVVESSSHAAIGEVSAAEPLDPEPLAILEALAPAGLAEALPTNEQMSPAAISTVATMEGPAATADAVIPAGTQQDDTSSDLTSVEPLTHAPLASTEGPNAPALIDAAPESLTRQATAASDRERVEVMESQAEAAVDAAFAALAETFGTGLHSPAGSGDHTATAVASSGAPAPSAPAPQPLALTPPPPAPIPPVGAAWPNLSRSALAMTAALQPSGAMPPGSPAAFRATVAAGAHDANQDTDPAKRTSAIHASSGDVTANTDATEANDPGQAFTALEPLAAEEAQEASEDAPGAAVLLERLRGRLSWERRPRFTRLRAVMRDCVDETMALLRSPDADEDEEEPTFQPSGQAPAHDPFAPLDGPTQTPSATSSLAAPAVTPPSCSAASQAQATPVAAESAAIPSWEPPAPAQANPVAEESTATPSWEPLAPAPQPATATADRAARLRRGLLGRRGNSTADRPAPAPSALSDLRVWLPERDDLPRAS